MDRLLEAPRNLDAGAKAVDELGFGHQAEAIRDAILTIAHAAKSQIDSATGNKD